MERLGPEFKTVVSVCAWCPPSTYPPLKPGEDYSHGICKEHLEKYKRDLKIDVYLKKRAMRRISEHGKT